MKTLITALLCVFCLVATSIAEAPSTLKLLDGSSINGRVMSSTAVEVTIMSDFGVFRIPLAKLTEESRKALTANMPAPDNQALLARIAELEAKVSQLERENAALKSAALASAAPRPYTVPNSFSASDSTMRTGTGTATGVRTSSTTISSTGKRHNSSCRYYGTGRACGPTEGIACKICGG